MDIIFAIVLIAFGFSYFIWHLAKNRPFPAWGFSILLVAVFVGIFFSIRDKATRVTVKGIGSIETAVEQAYANADTVAQIKQHLQIFQDYSMAVDAARNDNRKAFEQLKSMAIDKSFPYHLQAQQASNKI